MEKELSEFFVITPTSNGKGTFQYLSNEARNQFLVKKGIIRLIGEQVVIRAEKGKEYLETMKEIDRILNEMNHKKMGSMGIDTSLVEKDINKIDREKVEQIKNDIDNIDPNEIDF